MPQVRSLRLDGVHTRYAKGGEPQHINNDLLPPPLQLGLKSLIEILHEDPPVEFTKPSAKSPSTKLSSPKTPAHTSSAAASPPNGSPIKSRKPATLKKERSINKTPFGSLRHLFSPKQSSDDPETGIGFNPTSKNQHVPIYTPQDFDGRYGPTTTQHSALNLQAQGTSTGRGTPPVYESYRSTSASGSSGVPSLEQEVNAQASFSSELKTPASTSFGSSCALDSDYPSPTCSPDASILCASPGKIHGEPPAAMTRPMIPSKMAGDLYRSTALDKDYQAVRRCRSTGSIINSSQLPEHSSDYPSPGLTFSRQGKLNCYAKKDLSTEALDIRPREETFDHRSFIARHAPPLKVEATGQEAERAMPKNQRRNFGLGISTRMSSQSSVNEILHQSAFSDDSDSLFPTPSTPQSPRFTEFFEKYRKTSSNRSSKKSQRNSPTLPRIHEDEASTAGMLSANERLARTQETREHSREDDQTAVLHTPAAKDNMTGSENEVTPSSAKVEKYFRHCTPDSIRSARMTMTSIKDRMEVVRDSALAIS